MNIFAKFYASVGFAIFLFFVSLISQQYSVFFAKQLFDVITPAGTAGLRLGIAALVLLAITRPWRFGMPKVSLPILVCYGASIGLMNLLYYMALNHIPQGIAAGVVFTGPLVISICTSRSLCDLIGVALAAIGMYFLLPISQSSANINTTGILFALASAVAWASYILLGKRVAESGQRAPVAFGMFFATMVTLPIGIHTSETSLFSMDVLPFAAVLSILSAALPFSLDIIVLRRLSSHAYSMLQSLQPGVAALSGFLFLGEVLTYTQCLAIGSIIIGSICITFFSHR